MRSRPMLRVACNFNYVYVVNALYLCPSTSAFEEVDDDNITVHIDAYAVTLSCFSSLRGSALRTSTA